MAAKEEPSMFRTPERPSRPVPLAVSPDEDTPPSSEEREARRSLLLKRPHFLQIPPTPDFEQDLLPSPIQSPVSGAAPAEPHEQALVSAVLEFQQTQKAQQKRKLQGSNSPRSPVRSPQGSQSVPRIGSPLASAASSASSPAATSAAAPHSPRTPTSGPSSPGLLPLGGNSRRASLAADAHPQIGPFYFPHGSPPSPSSRSRILREIHMCFQRGRTPGRLQVDEFLPVTAGVCELPGYANISLFLCIKRYERITAASRDRAATATAAAAAAGADNGGGAADAENPQSYSPRRPRPGAGLPHRSLPPSPGSQSPMSPQRWSAAQMALELPHQLALLDLRSDMSEVDLRSIRLGGLAQQLPLELQQHFLLQHLQQQRLRQQQNQLQSQPQSQQQQQPEPELESEPEPVGPEQASVLMTPTKGSPATSADHSQSRFRFDEPGWPVDDGTPAGAMDGLVDVEPMDPAEEERWMEEQLREGFVDGDLFCEFFFRKLAAWDPITRFFRILCRDPSGRYLERADFQPLVHEIVSRHPGLRFLENTPEFQTRYGQTVVCRTFYALDRHGRERITLRDLQRSCFVETLMMLDHEDDINTIHNFFSYEHFYVIYCQFWSLDSDHDGLISAEDLLQYEEGSLSRAVVDRIVQGYGRPLLSNVPCRLCYEDFVIFFISEVDKTNAVSVDYWTRIVDVDADQVLSVYEMEYFFKEQQGRLNTLRLPDPILFQDILCQLIDMIKPVARSAEMSPRRRKISNFDWAMQNSARARADRNRGLRSRLIFACDELPPPAPRSPIQQQRLVQLGHLQRRNLQLELLEQLPPPAPYQPFGPGPAATVQSSLLSLLSGDHGSSPRGSAAFGGSGGGGACRRLQLDIDEMELEQKECAAARFFARQQERHRQQLLAAAESDDEEETGDPLQEAFPAYLAGKTDTLDEPTQVVRTAFSGSLTSGIMFPPPAPPCELEHIIETPLGPTIQLVPLARRPPPPRIDPDTIVDEEGDRLLAELRRATAGFAPAGGSEQVAEVQYEDEDGDDDDDDEEEGCRVIYGGAPLAEALRTGLAAPDPAEDLEAPREPLRGFQGFTRAELLASGNAPAFFNTLFNLSKFLLNETKNAQAIHHRHATPELSEWDRYAVATYFELAEEEADNHGAYQASDQWDSVLYEDDWSVDQRGY